MPPISSIPNTRVSDAFLRQRLLRQVQFDQYELFRIQNQISTGRRIERPSQDAPAAVRSVSLQSLLEQKKQVQANLTTNQSFLAASDAAISNVASLLADIRGAALSVADTVSTAESKRAVAQQVQRAIQQLIDTGNQKFRGRFLFGGSQTTRQPLLTAPNGVLYAGNQRELLSYSDLDVLFETNITAHEIFGTVSTSVQSTADLNPALTENTRLRDLRGGMGITPGSIAVSNGTHTSVIDISNAETIGDIARLLERFPPAGSQVTAFVAHDGLRISVASGTISIREVGAGTTAEELGILAQTGVTSIVGASLDPQLTLTTPLADLLGTRARGRYASLAPDSTLVLEANRNGSEYNGYTITFAAGGVAGAETVLYNATAKTIQVNIEVGKSTAQTVVDALNSSPAAAHFTARLAPGVNGTGAVDTGSFVTAEGSGDELDLSSGLRIVNGDSTHVVTFDGAKNVQDLLNILNGSGAGVLARINDAGTSIDIHSLLSGGDFAIGENGGQTATQLGVRSFHLQTPLDELNFGRGVGTAQGSDLIIRRKDGVELAIDLDAISAAVHYNPPGANNALRILALPPGSAGNAYSFQVLDSGLGGGNSVFLSANTLTFRVDLLAGFTAQDAIDLLNASPLAAQFTAELDNSAETGNDGSGLLAATSAPLNFSGGVDAARTIADVINLINGHPLNVGKVVTAGLARYGNGIELTDDNLSGSLPLTVLADDQATAAYDLGFVGFQQLMSAPPTPGSLASARINPAGANNALLFQTKAVGAGGNNYAVAIQDNGGGPNTVALVGNVLTFNVNLTGGFTASNAIALLAGSPLSSQFTATLDTTADPGNNGSGNLAATAATPFSGGLAETLAARDVNPREVEGIFTALFRLRDALNADDLPGITRALQLLDDGAVRQDFARAELGARQQALDVLSNRLDDEEIELRKTLSLELDVDLVEAISELTARQAAFEAALRALGQTLRLTLLEFL